MVKTREQLYGKEAACLLRDISSYHCIRRGQLYRLYPHKDRGVLDNLLGYLVKQGRVFYSPRIDIYYDSPDFETDWEMLSALLVLADFADRAEYHSPDDFPVKIIFFADGEVYEVICVPPDKETLVEHALARSGEEGGRRILIVEGTEQIARLRVPGTAAFCTVSGTGEIQYFKQKQEEPY